MKKLALLFSLSLTGILAFAQADFRTGYVLTLNGDTLNGLIDYRGDVFNSTTCNFKPADSNDKVSYSPFDISGYRITDGKYYVSREVKIDSLKRKVFLEFLVDGKANLYYMPEKLFFIETDNNGLHILENTERIVNVDGLSYFKNGNEYIGVLNIYLKDCPEIRKDIARSKLDQSGLIEITTDYHNLVCPDEKCVVYAKRKPKTEIRFGISAGADINFISVYTLNSTGYYTLISSGIQPAPSLALNMDMFSIGSFERMFTTLSFGYSRLVYDNTDGFTMHMVRRNLKVSYLFNYIYPKFKLKPYGGLGGVLYLTFNDDESFMGGEGNHYNPEKKTFGPAGCVGVIYDLNDRISLKFQTEYLYGLWNTASHNMFQVYTDNINTGVSFMYSLSK